MSDQFLGQILLVPYNFAPQGWAFCQGQILPISQNTALFSLLGTNYGGNGTSTFALPNLQGAVIVSSGQGAGLQPYNVGESLGEQNHTLLTTEMPAHVHTIPASAAAGRNGTPGPGYSLGTTGRGGIPVYATPAEQSNSIATMSGSALSPDGNSQPHNNLMPYLVLNYIIALQGIYPSRS